MIVLGIETSCDETAVAIVDDDRRIRAQKVVSQIEQHQAFGGVVPEIAARAHLEVLDPMIEQTMADAKLEFGALDAIAATAGPGLIGGLMVGVMAGKTLAAVHDRPFLAINHLEAHALTARLTDDVAFPYLLLLLSGGHCQLLIAESVGRYRRLGTTIDDALGEAFDKVAAMLGLGYPGGVQVEQAARGGNPGRFALPRPMLGRPQCHFSFSGLKTAVRRVVMQTPHLIDRPQDISDLCASFQAAAIDVVIDRTKQALAVFREQSAQADTIVVAGGVAANKALRGRLDPFAASEGVRLVIPPAQLCTDNAAMVAWAGIERWRTHGPDPLDFAPRPRWPLDPHAPRLPYVGGRA